MWEYRWAYRVLTLDAMDMAKAEAALNEAGRAGWRLMSASVSPVTNQWIAIMEQPPGLATKRKAATP